MILKKDEFMEKLKLLTEGKTDDETLKIIEDFNDTIDAIGDGEDVEAIKSEYEQKLVDLDTSWREKYKNAFFNGPEGDDGAGEPQEPEDPEENEEPTTYDELFEEVKK